MEGLLVFGVVVVALGLLDVLALRFGVDSRLESDDPRSPARGITL
ncbi:MAG TPA: hypothetical protein VGQ58_11255 [Candidatus Limnocylindrales bacterium]|jgi:hypothetical protein|nr:hypothetical protein [Candidatus Limnocylindrales bacterium]